MQSLSSTSLLKDLFEDALSHATYSKEIGVLLGLPSAELTIIEKLQSSTLLFGFAAEVAGNRS